MATTTRTTKKSTTTTTKEKEEPMATTTNTSPSLGDLKVSSAPPVFKKGRGAKKSELRLAIETLNKVGTWVGPIPGSMKQKAFSAAQAVKQEREDDSTYFSVRTDVDGNVHVGLLAKPEKKA